MLKSRQLPNVGFFGSDSCAQENFMRRTTRKLRDFAMVCVLLILLGFHSSMMVGQAISGNLTGTVVDPSGAAVNGATVEVLSLGTGQKATTTTKTLGEYRFTDLP